jgi:hypothetical protein
MGVRVVVVLSTLLLVVQPAQTRVVMVELVETLMVVVQQVVVVELVLLVLPLQIMTHLATVETDKLLL